MASTTDLGKWMITNGGVYNPEAVYEQLTMVMYDNSTYITLKTVQGVTPTDDHVNYQLMAKGSVQAEDPSGVLGEVGGTVSAQDLIDWVVDQAATKLLKISDLVSVQTNDATKGVSAALAYAMNQSIDQLNSNLDSGYFKIKVKTTTIVLIIEEFTFTNGVATKTLQSIFGNIPTYASGICQTKVEDSSVYNFTAVKDGNNLKIATAGSTFSGKKWVTMIIFGTA